MAGRKSGPRRRGSSTIRDRHVSKFGRVIIALSPVKPALWLAQRVSGSERHANRLISGELKLSKSKLSGAALRALINEIFE